MCYPSDIYESYGPCILIYIYRYCLYRQFYKLIQRTNTSLIKSLSCLGNLFPLIKVCSMYIINSGHQSPSTTYVLPVHFDFRRRVVHVGRERDVSRRLRVRASDHVGQSSVPLQHEEEDGEKDDGSNRAAHDSCRHR